MFTVNLCIVNNDFAINFTILAPYLIIQLFSLKDDFTKIRTLARTLHERAVRNSRPTLRNSGSSEGKVNFKIYYSDCIVPKNLNFDP
jgi:hypothetical protein